MAPLDAALALRQRYDAALAIAKDLHLDVPRTLHVLLHKHARVPKAGFALPVGGMTTRWSLTPALLQYMFASCLV